MEWLSERPPPEQVGGWLALQMNNSSYGLRSAQTCVHLIYQSSILPPRQAGIQPGKQPDSYNWMVQRSNSDTGEDSKVGLKIIRDYWLLPTVYPERHEQVGTLLMTSHFVFDPQGEG